jgi:hypothetical protein
MGMSNWDKRELAKEVKQRKKDGWSKAGTIEALNKRYGWNTATIAKYWKVFNEKKTPIPPAPKGAGILG